MTDNDTTFLVVIDDDYVLSTDDPHVLEIIEDDYVLVLTTDEE